MLLQIVGVTPQSSRTILICLLCCFLFYSQQRPGLFIVGQCKVVVYLVRHVVYLNRVVVIGMGNIGMSNIGMSSIGMSNIGMSNTGMSMERTVT